MSKIILSGALGTMGKAVTACVAKADDMEIIAGIDLKSGNENGYPVFCSFKDIPEDITAAADAVVDFSKPALFEDLLSFCVENSKPVVVATTGLSEEQVIKLKSAAYKLPVFYTANMSIGVNLLIELAKKAAKALGDDFDIEVLEMHHNQKVDAPSGTALMIADAISQELSSEPVYEYDRHSKHEKRPKNEIGLHSIRGGNIVGEHQVIFAGNDEIITLSHSARSKALFANGAVNAVRLIVGRENGLYSMKDIIDG